MYDKFHQSVSLQAVIHVIIKYIRLIGNFLLKYEELYTYFFILKSFDISIRLRNSSNI